MAQAKSGSVSHVYPGYDNSNSGTVKVKQQRVKCVSRKVTDCAHRWKQLLSDWVTWWLDDIRSDSSDFSVLLHGVIMGCYLQQQLRHLEPGEP